MKSFTLEKTVPIKLIFVDQENNMLDLVNYDISFTMVTEADEGDSTSMLEAQLRQNISYTKILTFIEGILDNSVVYAAETESVYSNLSEYNNNFLVLPALGESQLISALHCKLNVIAEPNTFVDSVVLKDTVANISYQYVITPDEGYSELPVTQEWVGEFPFWDTPWWYRYDISTMDNNAETQEQYQKWLDLKSVSKVDDMNTQTFREIEEQLTELFHEVKKTKPSCTGPGEIIEVDFAKKSNPGKVPQ